MAVISVEASNHGRTVDQLSFDVRGVPAAWATVEPPSINLLPGTGGNATVTLRPPRTPGVRAGPAPFDIEVRSREHPDASLIVSGILDIAPFVVYETALVPSILRSDRSARARVTVANHGNAPLTMVLSADDPELALDIRLMPPSVLVEPGLVADCAVTVTARQALDGGTERSRPFRILTTDGAGARRIIDGTFIQSPVTVPPVALVPATPRRRRRVPCLVWVLTLIVLVLGGLAFLGAIDFWHYGFERLLNPATAPEATAPSDVGPPADEATPAGPAEPQVYVVRAGDTVSSIASRFGISVDALMAANPQINDPAGIRVGDQILIPAP